MRVLQSIIPTLLIKSVVRGAASPECYNDGGVDWADKDRVFSAMNDFCSTLFFEDAQPMTTSYKNCYCYEGGKVEHVDGVESRRQYRQTVTFDFNVLKAKTLPPTMDTATCKARLEEIISACERGGTLGVPKTMVIVRADPDTCCDEDCREPPCYIDDTRDHDEASGK